MKFVHIADLHLDMPFSSIKNNKEVSSKRRLEQKFVLKKVINYIKENNVDLLFISGDLFEHKFVQEDTINYIISLFNEIIDTKIYISPGNHDPLIKSSPYLNYDFPDNVFIFSKEIGLDRINGINIYGEGFDNFEMYDNELNTINLNKDEINILVTHGTLNGNSKIYNDISEKTINNYDYVALRTYTSKKSR